MMLHELEHFLSIIIQLQSKFLYIFYEPKRDKELL